MPYAGELSALLTAFLWAGSALAFESASKRVGSLSVNFIRLLFGLILLCCFTAFNRGMVLPFDAGTHEWLWLGLSGLTGLVIGDFLLFKAFVIIGSRLSMLMMTLVPPFTAFLGWIWLGEIMSVLNFVGMAVTLSGIAIVVLTGRDADGKSSFLRLPLKGLLFALGGALGQALGLVISKYGMGDYNAFAATQIRVIAGLVGFGVLVILFRRIKPMIASFSDKKAVIGISLGSFLGPFLGISFSLIAVQNTETGIASTIMSIVPVIIIPPAIILFRQKVSPREVIGAIISVCGVAIFFL